MKKRLLSAVSFLLFLFVQVDAQKSTLYCGLENIETIKDVLITKRDIDGQKEKLTVSLDENQKNEFINRIKISRQEKYIKVFLKYEVSVSYDGGKNEKFYMTGRVIKKQDGTTYKLDNSMTLFLDSLFSKNDPSENYKEKIIETSSGRVHVYQANYSRNDLTFVGGSGPLDFPEILNCAFKIGQELIDSQDIFTKKHLKNYIKSENLKKIADSYVNEVLDYSEPLFYSCYELYPLDAKQEKWIIYFAYVTKKHKGKKEYADESVFMMPNGTIVISDNNYENIKF